MPAKKRRNPFYIVLIPVGLAFVVTAFAYGFMAFQSVNGIGVDIARYADHPLYQWLRSHGDAALVAELVVLAVLTVAAMAFDSWSAEAESLADQFEIARPKRGPDHASEARQ